MALFAERPNIEKNAFTAADAGQVFRNAADEIDKGGLPSEVADLAITVAQLLLQIGATFVKKD